jgi:hypothetical protein
MISVAQSLQEISDENLSPSLAAWDVGQQIEANTHS